ncbi:MAG: hypothetical protein PHG66_06495 [Candidatus Colwellbacteria bacterium]|nr:hypothetical protein [Candidatus Colwellbacteria bacterium]
MSSQNKTGLVIGCSGKIGSGKNYLAETKIFDTLHEMGKNVVVMAFGDYLKMMCLVKDGISYDKLFYDKDQQTRKILQTRGMKERETDDMIFIKMLECHMKIAFDRNIDVIIISDLRFNIEFEFLKSLNAVLFRVNAPKRTYDKMIKECVGDEKAVAEIAKHVSEIELDLRNDFDHYLDNDYEHEESVVDEISDIMKKIVKSRIMSNE